MHDRSMLCEFLDLAGYPIVETNAKGQQQVRFVHGAVCVHGSMHAEPFQGERMTFGETANSHESCRHRNLGSFREFQQLSRCIR